MKLNPLMFSSLIFLPNPVPCGKRVGKHSSGMRMAPCFYNKCQEIRRLFMQFYVYFFNFEEIRL